MLSIRRLLGLRFLLATTSVVASCSSGSEMRDASTTDADAASIQDAAMDIGTSIDAPIDTSSDTAATDTSPTVDVPPGDTPTTDTPIASDVIASCDHIEVTPSADVTTALRDALMRASRNPIAGLRGPSGMDQGRVYLGPGEYPFGPIDMVSNVRIEIAPGATLRPIRGADGPGPSDWGMLVFGSTTAPVRNVTITAGDGCGGPGIPTMANKPSNTNFRGNDPMHGGMGNAAIPFTAHWPVDTMWVFDIDPGQYMADVNITAMFFHWAYDVRIERIFTIQNAARLETGVGPIAGATSRTTAMMFDPFNGAPTVSDPEMEQQPHRVTVSWHYNILAPSGQGSNQVRACRDCVFEHIFSHGGDALRLETDGIPAGTFATVDNLRGDDIEGAYGNRSLQVTPHCQSNGTVTISNIRGTSQAQIVAIVGGESGCAAGAGFRAVNVENVSGCGGHEAQAAMASLDSYLLEDSEVAIADMSTYAHFAGTYVWPAPPLPGLRDGNLPPSGVTVMHPAMCP